MGATTAFSLVVANMIGTGVFTSLGFQVVDLHTGTALLALWVVGGLVALCGALTYAELGAALPTDGGEYRYLTRAFGPSVGMASGWVSLFVGFAAPTALAAIAFGRYVAPLAHVPPTVLALGLIVLVTAVHALSVRVGSRFHVWATLAKIAFILVLCIAGLRAVRGGDATFFSSSSALWEITTPGFAVSLIYVSYAFSGWNAAAYIAGEVRAPERTLPRALITGTLLVTVLYVLLNYVFLRTVPLAELSGRVEVGALAAAHIFGTRGEAWTRAALGIILASTVSAMTFAGPRVVSAMAADSDGPMTLLARFTRTGTPRNAILVQQVIALALVLTGSFDAVVAYAGFTLSMFTALTAAALIRLRKTAPALARPFRVPLYPFTPLVFIVLTAWTLVFMISVRTKESLAGLVTVAVCVLLHRYSSHGRGGTDASLAADALGDSLSSVTSA